MKTTFHLSAVGLACGLVLGSLTAEANFEVSAGFSIQATADFYAPLGEQGDWMVVGSYGRCWRPAHVAIEWRPYCWGHWVWTDCGWYWQSDEPWAWACYHYGWWVYDPVYFWVWVPGIEWAPAWVEWRVGGGCIGWAPLPPRGFSVTVGAPEFVFVQSSRFADPLRPSTVIVNNTAVFNQTTVINNIKQESRSIGSVSAQKVFVNEGPGLETIQVATGRKMKPVAVQEAARQSPAPKNLRKTDDLRGRQTPNSSPADPFKPAPERKVVPGENHEQQMQPPSERKERQGKDSQHGTAPPSQPAAPPPSRQAPPPEQAIPPHPRPANPPKQAAPARPRETPPPKEVNPPQGQGKEHDKEEGGHGGEGHGKDKPGE